MCRQLGAFACQQLSVHSARNQVALATPTAALPKDQRHNWTTEEGMWLTQIHWRICNKLQEVHSSKLISIRPCDWFPQNTAEDFCHQEQLSVQLRTKQAVVISDKSQPRESDDGISRSRPARIIQANLSAENPRFCSNAGLPCVNSFESRLSRSVSWSLLKKKTFTLQIKCWKMCFFSTEPVRKGCSNITPNMGPSGRRHPSIGSLRFAAICWCIYNIIWQPVQSPVSLKTYIVRIAHTSHCSSVFTIKVNKTVDWWQPI